MRLDQFNNAQFDRGQPAWVEAVWMVVSALAMESALPGSAFKRFLLRIFGAKIGQKVVIKPHVRIKFPWKLKVGDHSWIGEGVWIDNIAEVTIGAHTCISQGAYLCTGNHRWDRERFDLLAQPIVIGGSCWIGAQTRVAPGVTVHDEAVLTLGSAALSDLKAGWISTGNPAIPIKTREPNTSPDET